MYMYMYIVAKVHCSHRERKEPRPTLVKHKQTQNEQDTQVPSLENWDGVHLLIFTTLPHITHALYLCMQTEVGRSVVREGQVELVQRQLHQT